MHSHKDTHTHSHTHCPFPPLGRQSSVGPTLCPSQFKDGGLSPVWAGASGKSWRDCPEEWGQTRSFSGWTGVVMGASREQPLHSQWMLQGVGQGEPCPLRPAPCASRGPASRSPAQWKVEAAPGGSRSSAGTRRLPQWSPGAGRRWAPTTTGGQSWGQNMELGAGGASRGEAS